MPHSSPVRVRFAIVAMFSALALGFLISPGNAQPGRPPGFPSRPMPPVIPPIQPLRPPGGITGMPGGIGGMPGGIHGGGIGGMPGGIGGMPGGPGTTVYTWSCEKCKASLGTTTTPTSPHVRCPSCGVIFTGTTISPGGGTGRPPGLGLPGGTTPDTGTPVAPYVPPATEPTLPTNPAVGGSGAVPTSTPAVAPPVVTTPPTPTNPPAPAPAATDTTSAPSAAPSGGRSKTIALVGIVIGGLLFLGAMAALAFVVSNASATKPTRRKVKRKVLDDDE